MNSTQKNTTGDGLGKVCESSPREDGSTHRITNENRTDMITFSARISFR